jgi:hypothetical protein
MAGRNTKYKPEYCELVFKLSIIGLTDVQMAEVLDISERTFNRWKNDHALFCQSLKDGKEKADANVAKSLYQRAMGYSHPETKVFCQNGDIITHDVMKHYPPDVTAIIFWLKNRMPHLFRDKQEVDHSGEVSLFQLKPFKKDDDGSTE